MNRKNLFITMARHLANLVLLAFVASVKSTESMLTAKSKWN